MTLRDTRCVDRPFEEHLGLSGTLERHTMKPSSQVSNDPDNATVALTTGFIATLVADNVTDNPDGTKHVLPAGTRIAVIQLPPHLETDLDGTTAAGDTEYIGTADGEIYIALSPCDFSADC